MSTSRQAAVLRHEDKREVSEKELASMAVGELG